ncbi:hypothetical protein JG688_00017775 [Phytophthora aleatoria]|uniref:Uncharacterized protein n=1 Tax=Phytophthora aleatoria TaxID=2496075 RepID=A0A8J5IGX2_9STRA|nr:hypothetical protein JG688_00017775 [Phytophthora aleatoria]
MVALEVKEDRSGSATSKVRGGTHYAIKPEISNLAKGGSGPKKILMQLVLNHAGDPRMLSKIPSEKQVKTG